MAVPKISIIIPVYNVSKYLEKCLNAVTHQTLQDIEIIIINDQSPDPEDDRICENFAKNDARIIYKKHKQNLGLGGARNTGIQLATGQYLGFVDSDDWIAQEMFEKLYQEAITQDCDVVVCGYNVIENEGKITSITSFARRKAIINTDEQQNIFEVANNAAWNKLWKRSLFTENDVFFPTHTYYEDLATTLRLFYYARKIHFISDAPYNYVQEKNSISHSFKEKNIHDFFFVFNALRDFLEEKNIYHVQSGPFYRSMIDHLTFHADNVVRFLNKDEAKTYLIRLINTFISKIDLKDFLDSFSSREINNLFHFVDAAQRIDVYENDRWYNAGRAGKMGKIKFILGEIKRYLIH